nr:MAG TPA_asm: hypothetical protein [Caudoviricetes sp.]
MLEYLRPKRNYYIVIPQQDYYIVYFLNYQI